MRTAGKRACVLGLWLLINGLAAGAEEYQAPEVDEKMRHALRQAMYATDSFPDQIAAQVWLTDMSTRLAKTLQNPFYRVDLLKVIHEEAIRAGLQPELVLAVIQVESNFDRFAISPVGARGLMQVMPFWIKEIGHPDDNLFIPRTNLRYGCAILRYYLELENNHINRALARYNGSIGQSRYPGLVMSAMRTKWFEQ